MGKQMIDSANVAQAHRDAAPEDERMCKGLIK
jgi:hypothetical protein